MRWSSTIATRRPASPRRPAHTSPAGPAPRTPTSNSRSLIGGTYRPPRRPRTATWKVGRATVYFCGRPRYGALLATADTLLKPNFATRRKHFIFTEEHDQLRESIH